MKSLRLLVACALGLAVAGSAGVALAYVAVVGTAIPITATSIEDKAQLDAALQSAVRDVLETSKALLRGT